MAHLGRPAHGEDEATALKTFAASTVPQIGRGLRSIVDLADRFGADCLLLTYERLISAPEATVAELFRFLAVADTPEIVNQSILATRFDAMTGGRARGDERSGEFLRSGNSGDWRTALPTELGQWTMRELSWSAPIFGWTP